MVMSPLEDAMHIQWLRDHHTDLVTHGLRPAFVNPIIAERIASRHEGSLYVGDLTKALWDFWEEFRLVPLQPVSRADWALRLTHRTMVDDLFVTLSYHPRILAEIWIDYALSRSRSSQQSLRIGVIRDPRYSKSLASITGSAPEWMRQARQDLVAMQTPGRDWDRVSVIPPHGQQSVQIVYQPSTDRVPHV